ncbi:MAG: AAA family ATPase [Chloroflexi bacterium]|nr:AAA family ATPase [Chloroflexota bacterium]
MAIRRIALLIALVAILVSAVSAQAGGDVTWTLTGGPTGGFVNALVSAPDARGVLFAGTNAGVFLTRDAGAHWQLVSNGLPDDRVISALAATADASVVFAGTHSGVYRTRDSGAHWTLADPRLANQLILALLIDSQTPSIIYAGTTTTVFKSENGGDSWTDIGQDLRGVQVWSLALTDDGSALYAATDTGVYASPDRGAHWARASEGLPEGARSQALAINARGFFVGTTQGLFRSTDGVLWNAASGVVSGMLVRPILADPNQPDRLFAMTAQGLAKSSDAGATWTLITNGPGDAQILSIAFGDGNSVFVGTARGVLKSDDGATWQLLNTGLTSSSIFSLILSPTTPDTLLAATRFGLEVSRDHGVTWRQAQGLTDPYILSLAVDPRAPQILYAGTWGSSLFISQDSGATFTRLTANLANNAPIGSLAILHPTANATTIVAGTLGSSVYRSSNNGQTWTAQAAGLGSVARVTALAFAPPSTLYAGTDRGVFRVDPSNVNAQWTPVSSDLPADEVRAIAVDPQQPKTLFLAYTSSGLYRSDDNGTNWASVGRGAFPTRVRFQSFARNPGHREVMYVGTDRGIFRSDDDGKTWTAANDGLPPGSDVQAIAIDPASPDKLFVGTSGNGVVSGVDQFQAFAPAPPDYSFAALALAAVLVAGVLLWRVQLSPAAQQRAWTRDWPLWESAITHSLWTFGQANETNLHKLPRRPLVRALQRFMEQHPDDGLTLQASPVALKLDSYIPAQKFFSHWKAAWQVGDNEEAFASITSQMVDQLCMFLGFARVDERAYKGLIGYVVRAPSLRLKIPPRFPVVFIPHHEVGEEDISALRDLMGVLNMTSYFALIIDLRDAPDRDQRQSLKRLVRQAIHDFIVLDGLDMRSLIAARDHAHRLVEIILDQVDLTVVSPYVTSGPVPENMFFGREHELKTIMRTVRDTSFAIVGGRKIGKTSVLARVYRLLQEAPEFQPFYLDCQAIHTETDFFEAIDTLWHLPLPAPTPEGFRRMATDLLAKYPNRSIVMLFDEIDGLILSDVARGERLFQILRALSQENQIRYIFCGEKLLSAALHDPQLVFFNFCNVLPLTYLTPAEARRVVIEPMQEMGITLEKDGELADHIVQLTAGHPNIVQYICQKLIERINIRRERIITRADVNALSQSAQFAEYFATISWGNANALERLITLHMLECPAVTMGEMGDLLREQNLGVTPTQLENAFDGLCLYSILRRDGPKYAFAADAFPEVLRHSQDVNGLRASLIQEIQQDHGAPG